MEEKLPGLTQLLVHHHVKEVIDEVTCEDRENSADVNDVFGFSNLLLNQSMTDLFEERSLGHVKCIGGAPCFHGDSDASKMRLGERLFISTNRHGPYPWRQPFKMMVK